MLGMPDDNTAPDTDQDERSHRVTCLCVDVVGSTATGVRLTSRQFRRFNRAVVKQIEPHLASCGLSHALLKFTGDGWLVFASDDQETDRSALCCLATVMAVRFRPDIAQLLRVREDCVPPLRLAVADGDDVRVTLPNRQPDFVGDSARRAVRASKQCLPGEILVSEPVRASIFRDFCVLVEEGKKAGAEDEEQFDVFPLRGVNPNTSTDLDAPEAFVYTLAITGRTDEAISLLLDRQEDASTLWGSAVKDRVDLINCWRRIIECPCVAYGKADEAYTRMKKAGGLVGEPGGSRPGRDSSELKAWMWIYRSLMNKAPSYDRAEEWRTEMRKMGLRPDHGMYRRLIQLAPKDEGKTLIAEDDAQGGWAEFGQAFSEGMDDTESG